jgi:invasion protein IalB
MRVLIALMALALPAAAQDATAANGTRFGDWTLSCEALGPAQTVCVLRQTLVETGGDDERFLVELLAFPSPDGARTWIAARVPLGVHLPSGFALRAGDDDPPLRFDWQSCSRDLCEALLALDDASALDGVEVIAGYRPAPGAGPAVFRVGMAGLADGLAALR